MLRLRASWYVHNKDSCRCRRREQKRAKKSSKSCVLSPLFAEVISQSHRKVINGSFWDGVFIEYDSIESIKDWERLI
jgi:hypothetical protein